MNCRVVYIALLIGLPGITLQSAEEARGSRMKDLLRARIADDAKKTAKKTGTGKTATDATPATPAAPAAAESPSEEKAKSPVASKRPATKNSKHAAGEETPTLLPRMEVRKSRITELDQQLAKQERDIARERKNLKATEADKALNDSKIARPLAIFGGESSQFREHVASERVELMETEKDLIEAIARAKTKEEKKELQKQLNELKMVRRELEKSLR